MLPNKTKHRLEANYDTFSWSNSRFFAGKLKNLNKKQKQILQKNLFCWKYSEYYD